MIYIVKPTGEILGSINGLKEESCNLKRILTDLWEISFEVTKYINIDGNLELSDYYDSISEKMLIRLETDTVDTMFVIDSEPVISNNGIQEIKTVTAHTTECDLQYKSLRSFYINTGSPTSLEYLANNNLNQYTQLPNEYISLVNFKNHELSLLHLALENTEWTIDESLKETEPEMCEKKFTFSIDEQDIYSFLLNNVANVARIIFFFDRKNRIVSFKSYKNLGEDTGIFIGLRNLANQIDIESTSESGLITKYKPTCDESLGVEYVNFGDPYIYNMDYFVNAHNEYGDYKYVTQSFHDEYVAWIKKRNDNRQDFINFSKEYNKNLIAIDELKNRLPNDGCSIDYKAFKADELYFSLNAYENALVTLITLYKEDFSEKYTSPDMELDENHLKTTMYWNDYYSYKYQIIPSVKEAMKIWYKTDNNGNLLVDSDGKYILCENGNPVYANNTSIVKPVDSFKYEFDLYGLDELQSKKKAWMECANLLYKDGFKINDGIESIEFKKDLSEELFGIVLINENGNSKWSTPQNINEYINVGGCWKVVTSKDNVVFRIPYNVVTNGTGDGKIYAQVDNYYGYEFNGDRPYFEVVINESGEHTLMIYYYIRNGIDSIYAILNFGEYIKPDKNGWDSLTSDQKSQFTTLTAFQENLNNYLDYMSFEVRDNLITGTKCKGIVRQCEDAIEQRQTEINLLESLNNTIQTNRDTLSSSVLPENNFSDDNLKIFRLLIHESNYSNDNIVVTSPDDILSKIDIAEELYQDAQNHLGIVSQPQYSFKTTVDNIFALEEFSPLHNEMDIGNFVRLIPDLFNDDFVKLRLISITTNPVIDTNDIAIEFSTMTKSLSDISDLSFLFENSNISSRSSRGSSGSNSGTYGKNDAEIQIANNMLNALLKSETFGTQVSDVILDSIKGNKGNFGKLLAHSGIFDTLESGEVKVNGACLTDIIKSLNYIANQKGSMFNLKDGSIDFAGGSLTYDKDKGLIIKGSKGKTSVDGSSVNTGAITSNNYNGTSANPLGNTEGSIIDLTDGQFNFGGGKLKFKENILSVEGDITANTLTANTAGTIAGWNFDSEGFYRLDTDGKKQMILGANGISISDKFSVNQYGEVVLKNIDELQVEYANLGDFYIGGHLLGCQLEDGKNIQFYDAQLYSTYFDEDINYHFGNDGIGIYDKPTLDVNDYYRNNTKLYASLKYDSLATGGYLILKTRYWNDCYDEENKYIGSGSSKVDNKCIYDSYGIHGTITECFTDKSLRYDSPFSFYGKNYPENAKKSDGIKYDAGQTTYIFNYGKHLCNSYLQENTGSTGSQLRLDDSGEIFKYASSSKRYKKNITSNISPELNPSKLYDLPIVQFVYKDDYLKESDQRYGKNIIGFIAEDIYDISNSM